MIETGFTQTAFTRFLTDHRLMGVRCKSCGTLHVPPRPMCSACHSTELEWEQLSGNGELTGFTSIFVGAPAMLAEGYSRDHPYCTGIVRLAEGPAISAQILGIDASRPENIPIGMPVKVAFIERGPDGSKRTYLAFTRAEPE